MTECAFLFMVTLKCYLNNSIKKLKEVNWILFMINQKKPLKYLVNNLFNRKNKNKISVKPQGLSYFLLFGQAKKMAVKKLDFKRPICFPMVFIILFSMI